MSASARTHQRRPAVPLIQSPPRRGRRTNPTLTFGALAYWAADAIRNKYLKNAGPLVMLKSGKLCSNRRRRVDRGDQRDRIVCAGEVDPMSFTAVRADDPVVYQFEISAGRSL